MRVLLLALAILPLAAADRPATEKLSVNYEIPLWAESKVPLSKGDSALYKTMAPPEMTPLYSSSEGYRGRYSAKGNAACVRHRRDNENQAFTSPTALSRPFAR
jgi:hypothetical protein